MVQAVEIRVKLNLEVNAELSREAIIKHAHERILWGENKNLSLVSKSILSVHEEAEIFQNNEWPFPTHQTFIRPELLGQEIETLSNEDEKGAVPVEHNTPYHSITAYTEDGDKTLIYIEGGWHEVDNMDFV